MWDRCHKGVEDFIGVMLAILVIAVFASTLFFINFSSSRNNINVLGKSIVGIESKDVLLSYYGLEYPVSDEDNQPLIYALRYGCQYGQSKGGKFIVSRTVPIVFDGRLFTEKYMEGKIGNQWQLTGNCSGHIIELGKSPPDDVEIVSTPLMFPNPGGGYNEFLLRRWI